MKTAETVEALERDARDVASRCNMGEIFHKRQEVLKLAYYKEITDGQRDKLLAILQPSNCGG